MFIKGIIAVLTLSGLSLCAGKVINVKDFGAKGDNKADDRPAFTKAFEAAAAAGPGTKVIIPKGIYRMKSFQDTRPRYAGHVVAKNIKNSVVEAEPGAVLMMTKRGNGVMIYKCDNTVFKNIVVDFDPLPFTQGTVHAFNAKAKTIDVTIDKGFPSPLRKGFIGPPARNRLNFYDPKTNRRRRDLIINWVGKAKDLGGGRIRLQLRNKVRNNKDVTGLRFALISCGGRSKGHGIFLMKSKEAKLYKTEVYSAYGCAYAIRDCDRAYMDGCLVTTKPGTTRLMTTDADGIHVKFNRRGPVIENCKIMYTDDDSINIAASYFRVCEQTAPNKVIVDIDGNARVGDEYVFFDFPTAKVLFRGKSIARRRVKWQKHPKYELTFKEKLPKFNTVKSLKHPAKWRITPRARKKFLKEGAPVFAYNNDATGRGSIIRNNYFGHNWPRGILIRANDGLIENNTFEDQLGPSIIAGHDFVWGEGPNSCNLKIIGNTFKDIPRSNILVQDCAVMEGDKDRSITGLVIKGNRFEGFGAPSYHGRGRVGDAILIQHTTGAVVEDNVIGPPAKNILKPDMPYVEVEVSDNATIRNNKIIPASKKNWLTGNSGK